MNRNSFILPSIVDTWTLCMFCSSGPTASLPSGWLNASDVSYQDILKGNKTTSGQTPGWMMPDEWVSYRGLDDVWERFRFAGRLTKFFSEARDFYTSASHVQELLLCFVSPTSRGERVAFISSFKRRTFPAKTVSRFFFSLPPALLPVPHSFPVTPRFFSFTSRHCCLLHPVVFTQKFQNGLNHRQHAG